MKEISLNSSQGKSSSIEQLTSIQSLKSAQPKDENHELFQRIKRLIHGKNLKAFENILDEIENTRVLEAPFIKGESLMKLLL